MFDAPHAPSLSLKDGSAGFAHHLHGAILSHPMHRGRWWQLQDVVEGARGGIKRILESGVNRILR